VKDTTDIARLDDADIQATPDAYLEWSRTGDSELLGRAFHPQATVVNASNGDDKVAAWTIQQFADGVDRLRKAHGTVEETARSVSVDSARNVASVRVDFNLQIGEAVHLGTDYLTLARVGDRWLITHKVYDSDRPYAGPPR
jgi:hypothetical protein